MKFSPLMTTLLLAIITCSAPVFIPSGSGQKPITIEECDKIHAEYWIPMLPTQATIDWGNKWKQFRKTVRPTDRIILWQAPHDGPTGFGIERNEKIISIFELSNSTAQASPIPCDLNSAKSR